MAKVELQPQDDGAYTVMVWKTRPDENPTRVLKGVVQEQLAAEIAKAIAEVRGQTVLESPVLSP